MKKCFLFILILLFSSSLFAQTEKIEKTYCSWSGISEFLDKGDIYAGIFKDPEFPDEDKALKAAWGAFNTAWGIESLPHGLISEIFEPSSLNNINKGMGMVGNSLALLQIAGDYSSGDKLSAMSNSVKSGMFYAIGKWGWKSLKIAGAGLQVFDYMLTSFGNYYVDTKQEALRTAYFDYYGKGSGKRDLKTWKSIIKKLDGEKEIKKEIDDYLNLYFNADALDGPYMTVHIEDNIKAAVKKAYLHERLLPYLEPLFLNLNKEAREETLNKICKEYDKLVDKLNSSKNYKIKVNGDESRVAECKSAIQVMANGNQEYFVKGSFDDWGESKLSFTNYSLLVHDVTKARAVCRYKTESGYQNLYKEIDLKKSNMTISFDLPDEKEESPEEEAPASEEVAESKTSEKPDQVKKEAPSEEPASVDVSNLSKALFTTNGLPLDVKVKKTKETAGKYIGTLVHARIPKGNVLTINKTTGEMSLVYKLKGPFAPQLLCKGLPVGPNSYAGSIVTNDANAVNVGTFALVFLSNK